MSNEIVPLSPSRLPARTIFLAVLCNLLWAGAYITGKQAIGTPLISGFGPYRAAFLRFAVSGLLMFLWMRWKKPERLALARTDYAPMAFIGVFGITVTYLLNYSGLALSSGTAAALLLSTEPVWIALLALAFLRERVTMARLAGIVLGLAGAALVVISTQRPDSDAGGESGRILLGNLLMVASLLVESCGILVIKRLTARYSGQTIVVYQFLIGASLLLPFAIWEGRSGWILPPWQAWASLLYLIVACTLTAYTLWFILLETTDASDLSVYLFLQPVIGACLGVFVLHDPFTAWTGVGALLVMLGVWFTARAEQKGMAATTGETL